MFLEIRKKGKSKKYYLVHTYRDGSKVKRLSRYLGSNLSQKNLLKLKKSSERLIQDEIKEKNILEFELTKEEIEKYQKYDEKIKIVHLQKFDWKRFTETFTYNTNAIEGSTVILSEVKVLLNRICSFHSCIHEWFTLI